MIVPKFKTKIFYFGREVIRSNWNTMNKGPLTKAGLLVRKIARNSIKRRKKKWLHSPPGRPPYSHVEARTPPFKMIYSVPIKFGTGVIVGMVGFRPNNPVPGMHEHGLGAVKKVFVHRWRRYTKSGKRIQYRRLPPTKSQFIKYPPRPFMQPALITAMPQLPPLWANSLVGGRVGTMASQF